MVYCHLSISCIFFIFFFCCGKRTVKFYIVPVFIVPSRPWTPSSNTYFLKFMLLSYKYAHNQRNMRYMGGFVKCSCSYRWNFTPHKQTYIPRQKLFINFMTISLLSSKFLWHQNDCNMLTFIYNRPKPNSFFFKQKCNPWRQKNFKKTKIKFQTLRKRKEYTRNTSVMSFWCVK